MDHSVLLSRADALEGLGDAHALDKKLKAASKSFSEALDVLDKVGSGIGGDPQLLISEWVLHIKKSFIAGKQGDAKAKKEFWNDAEQRLEEIEDDEEEEEKNRDDTSPEEAVMDSMKDEALLAAIFELAHFHLRLRDKDGAEHFVDMAGEKIKDAPKEDLLEIADLPPKMELLLAKTMLERLREERFPKAIQRNSRQRHDRLQKKIRGFIESNTGDRLKMNRARLFSQRVNELLAPTK